MEEKIIDFKKDYKLYRSLAEKSVENGDYERAFGFLYSALSCSKNPYEAYADLADAYSETGQYEKAIEFWFKYLNSAPEDKRSIAYEELAVNFFYLDKIFEAGYYFHKKILADGVVSREGLGEEIADLLTTTVDRGAYHIAYPFDRADYSYEKNLGKKAFNMGDFKTASRIYDSIPIECMDEESLGDKAVAFFLQGEDDKSLESCKESIKINGGNLTAYCNLSTYYFNKDDKEKSAFYYKKALECFDNSTEQSYHMASCAIEQEDHLTANQCLCRIVKERKYDVIMRFYYAVSLINLGEYERAKEEFSFALRLNPFDRVINFYVNLTKNILDGEVQSLSLLPLKYQKEYPDKITKKFKRFIKELISEKKELSVLKKPENLDAIYWGIFCQDETLNKECAILLWFAKNVKGHKILTSLLLDNELRSGVKRVIIYTLIIFGYKEKFGVIAGNRFKKIKREKMPFDDVEGGELFASSYATVVARTAFWEIEEDEKLAKSIKNLFLNYYDLIIESALTAEEIAVVSICTANVEELKNEKEISSVFGVSYQKIKNIVKIVRGEKND